jgi:hypothetical protein
VHGVNAMRVIKNTLGQGCFSRIDMGTDTDVPDFSDVFVHLAFLNIWIKNPHLRLCAMGVAK